MVAGEAERKGIELGPAGDGGWMVPWWMDSMLAARRVEYCRLLVCLDASARSGFAVWQHQASPFATMGALRPIFRSIGAADISQARRAREVHSLENRPLDSSTEDEGEVFGGPSEGRR